ncbi:MAG: protein arginine kinase [Desulfotomaculaceae bacterium]|nr:protein arginine kinase [Desulfotomaculaceae bacterium]
MNSDGPDAGIVISSRIRIARNLAGVPFPHLLEPEKSMEVINEIKKALENKEAADLIGNMELTLMNDLSLLERQILVDKHLISLELLNNFQSRAAAIRDDEAVTVMINEEDHLRIQCLFSGLRLKEAWAVVNNIDDGLERTLDYAFSEKLGYLTSCPTNTGTGLRASVMLHLTGLKITNQLGGVFNAISKLGLTVRGLYGEGTEALGDLFQISNQITLGQSEDEIINNLISITKQLLAQEQESRQVLYRERREVIEDRVCRAYGILKCARILAMEETMRMLSDLRLGIELKIISGIQEKLINELIVKIRPAFLIKTAGQDMSKRKLDIARAGLIRKEFENGHIGH